MDIVQITRVLNILTTILTLPVSFYLLKVAIAERKIVDKLEQKLNTILIVLFAGVGIGSIINSLISIMVLLGAGGAAHDISRYRSITLNVFFAFITWALFLFHRQISKK